MVVMIIIPLVIMTNKIYVINIYYVINILFTFKIPKKKPLHVQALPNISLPQTGNAKNPPLNRPYKYKPPGPCTWKITLKYKVTETKQKR